MNIESKSYSSANGATAERDHFSAASELGKNVEKTATSREAELWALLGGERMLAAARDNPPTSRASVNQNRSSAKEQLLCSYQNRCSIRKAQLSSSNTNRTFSNHASQFSNNSKQKFIIYKRDELNGLKDLCGRGGPMLASSCYFWMLHASHCVAQLSLLTHIKGIHTNLCIQSAPKIYKYKNIRRNTTRERKTKNFFI